MTEPEHALQSPVASILTTSCRFSHQNNKKNNFLSRVIVKMINGYRYWVSPFIPASCRFYPSCSQYALESYQKLGFWRATYLSLWRIMKCNPFHPGGVDQVSGHEISDSEECAGLSEKNNLQKI